MGLLLTTVIIFFILVIMAKLTDKQKIFCKEYILDFNATRAATAAGYSKKTARNQGCENLSKPNIQKEIKRLMESRNQRTEITADRVVKELAKFAFNVDGSADAFDLEAKDKLKALEMLARHTGAFNGDDSGKALINVIMGNKSK